jgi:hypothetical protein
VSPWPSFATGPTSAGRSKQSTATVTSSHGCLSRSLQPGTPSTAVRVELGRLLTRRAKIATSAFW